MKFLIDECLHTSLVTLAHSAGHVCEHVNFLGLAGQTDWQLMTTVRGEDYIFVTDCARRGGLVSALSATIALIPGNLFGHEELHAGLVIIIPNVKPSLQRELFRAALAHVGET